MPRCTGSWDFPVERFGRLEPEKQELFRAQLVAFRSLYAFLSQIIPFQDTDLEKLYTFIRLLIPRLPKRSIGPGLVFDEEVNLKYYRLQKTSEGSISLALGDRGAVKAPTAVGMGEDHHEQIELSRLIDIVNERFGTEFKPADQLFFDQIARRPSLTPKSSRRPWSTRWRTSSTSSTRRSKASSSTAWIRTRKYSPAT
jgi:type I restriction enzyme R subunit